MTFLYKLHLADSHHGIKSLRNYILDRGYFIEGSSYLIRYIINNCHVCLSKNKSVSLREPSGQILTRYPKQRFVMDLKFH